MTRRVAAQGDVEGYCKDHGYCVREWYDGEPEEYAGPWDILVTDRGFTKNEYYALKYLLLRRNIELISTRWHDWDLDDLVLEMDRLDRLRRKRQHTGGRSRFGYCWRGGELCEIPEEMAVVRRIFVLRDEGKTYRQILEDGEVHRRDGSRLSSSTIQVIMKNRKKYGL